MSATTGMTDPTILSHDDHRQLIDLVHRYAHAVDSRSVADIVALFAEDGRLEFASTGVVADRPSGITEFFDAVFVSPLLGGDASASTHLMTNSVVTAGTETGTASIVTSAVAYLATGAAADGQVVIRGLTYTDRCVRQDGRWLIAHRIHRLHWQSTMPGGPISAEASPIG